MKIRHQRSLEGKPVSVRSLTAVGGVAWSLLAASCGGGGSSAGEGNLYAVARLAAPLQLVSVGDGGYANGYVGVTSDGRAFGNDGVAGTIVCTAPDYGQRTSASDAGTGLGHGVIVGENRGGNVVVDAGGGSGDNVYYATAISSSPADYQQLSKLSGYAPGPEFALGMNSRGEIIALEDLPVYGFLYYSSPTASPKHIYDSDYPFDIEQPPVGAIDDQGHIALWVGNADVFFSSPDGQAIYLKDIHGRDIENPVFLGSDGTMLAHVTGQKPSYILASDPTVTKLVNLGTGTDGYVNFVNSSGIACGYFADSGGNKHACIWKSLAQPPTDESYIAPGLRLVNVDFDFDSGVLIATDSTGSQYKLTPAH